MGRKKSW